MSRKAIPVALRHRIMYDSEYVCAVCQRPHGQIHHIDQDHTNNSEENLIFLCLRHHGEAHTKSTMTSNLTPEALRHAKQQWLATISHRRTLESTLDGQLATQGCDSFIAIGMTWGYINHRRVAQLLDRIELSDRTREMLLLCRDRGLVDDSGIILQPDEYVPRDNFLYNTVYDRFPHGDDQRLHKLYTSAMDDISRFSVPIHIVPENWFNEAVGALASEGSLLFMQARFNFKVVSSTSENEHRLVHHTKNKVRIEFYTDSLDMFGTTSIHTSFVGQNTCAALVQIKSFQEKKNGLLVIQCTPFALGVSFQKIGS